jgi:hypothetical protein
VPIERLDRVDPDLLAAVPPGDRERAAAASAVTLVGARGGPWQPPDDGPGHGHLGILLVEGLMLRRVEVGDRRAAELLGPGEILRPWVRIDRDSAVSAEANWVVQDDAVLALLDRRFALRMAPWPEVAAAIGDRIALRSRWLAFHLTVCHMASLSQRLEVMLWHLADRWGRVTPEGTLVPLRLTHGLLGELVGSRRPSVTNCLAALEADGVVSRRPDGRFLLHGDPPGRLRELRKRTVGG